MVAPIPSLLHTSWPSSSSPSKNSRDLIGGEMRHDRSGVPDSAMESIGGFIMMVGLVKC